MLNLKLLECEEDKNRHGLQPRPRRGLSLKHEHGRLFGRNVVTMSRVDRAFLPVFVGLSLGSRKEARRRVKIAHSRTRVKESTHIQSRARSVLTPTLQNRQFGRAITILDGMDEFSRHPRVVPIVTCS
jgi:hypothetical protein